MIGLTAAASVDDCQTAFWSFETLLNLATTDSIVNSYCNIYKYYRMRKIVISIVCKIGALNATTSFTAQQGRIVLLPLHDESDVRLMTDIPVNTVTSVSTFSPTYDIRFLKNMKHYKEAYRGLNAEDNHKLTLVMTPSTFEYIVEEPHIGSATVSVSRYKATYKKWIEVFKSSEVGNPTLDDTQHFGYAWFLYGWIWPATLAAGVPLDINCKVYLEFKEHRGVGSGFAPPVPPVELDSHYVRTYKSGDCLMTMERNKPIVAPKLGPRPHLDEAKVSTERSEEKYADYDSCDDNEMKK